MDRARSLRYKRVPMEPSLRALLLDAASDPSDERIFSLGERLAQTRPQDPEARAWLEEHTGLLPTRRRVWAAVGLRLWDSGRLKPAPAPPVSAARARKEPPAGPIENWRDLWSAPVSRLRGCGPVTADALACAGILTCADLLFQLPRGYLDFRTVVPVAECREKTPQLFFLHVDKVQRIGRKCFAVAHDDTGELQLMWFQFVPGLSQLLRRGADLYFIGEPHFHGNRRQLVHPRVLAERPSGVGVIYPATGGLGNGQVQRLMNAALAFVPDARTLPEEIERRHDLWSLRDALACIHHPEADRLGVGELRLLQEGTHPAQRRLLFEEVFGLQCAIGLRCGQGELLEACRVPEDRTPEYAAVFGFELTGAQRRVIGELLADLGAGRPMRRLLQGDVGSGKTAVSFVCAAHVIGIGRQVAVMAPTTLLAEQQFRSFSAWCARFGWTAALVTSDTPTAARESTLALLEAGKIHLIVGTHSLIQERIRFADLGLVVVDEQHRFGVDQRARLVNKGAGERPHLLVMTATPIPRSLALTVYGDLESSRIDELPPGRPTVVTRAYHTKTQKKQALARFVQAVSGEGKGFVIVPLIDATEDPERASIEVAVSHIRQQFPELPLGVLHGRMPLREREPILRDFESGLVRVLVATTVVEVGMDIPDANYMIILEADRFGLAQLHQLRGRIGRRPAPAAECMLFGSPKPTDDGHERLAWMERTASGFDLAEADLAMRGPGDMLGGKRQAGLFKPAWIRNLELLQAARAEARELLARDPALDAHPDLAFVVRTRFGEDLFDETGG